MSQSGPTQIVARLEEARVWLKGFTTAELDDKEQRKAMAQMTPRSGLGSGFTDAYDRDAGKQIQTAYPRSTHNCKHTHTGMQFAPEIVRLPELRHQLTHV